MNAKEVYRAWLEDPYFDEETKDELRSIAGDEKEIEERFYTDLHQLFKVCSESGRKHQKDNADFRHLSDEIGIAYYSKYRTDNKACDYLTADLRCF